MSNKKVIYRGDSQLFTVEVIQSDGTAFPLDGYEVKMTVKTSDRLTDAEATIGPITGTVTDINGGLATIAMTPTETDVAPYEYVYDIQLYNSDNVAVHTVVKSTFTVINDVTKGE